MRDKFGNPYGWGVAQYSTPERFYGKTFETKVYKRTPEESYKRLYKHLKEMLPWASEKQLKKML